MFLSSLIPKYLMMLQLLSHDAHDASTYVLRGKTKCPRSPYPAYQLSCTRRQKCLLLPVSLLSNEWLPWKLQCTFSPVVFLKINQLVWFLYEEKNVLVFLGSQDSSDIMSPSKRSSQKYVIDGLTEKSSQITDPWERLFKILSVVGMRCEWQMDKGRRWEMCSFPGISSQGEFGFLILKEIGWRKTLTWGHFV